MARRWSTLNLTTEGPPPFRVCFLKVWAVLPFALSSSPDLTSSPLSRTKPRIRAEHESRLPGTVSEAGLQVLGQREGRCEGIS